MAITTTDTLLAGFLPMVNIVKASATAKAAGVSHSMIYVAGMPGAFTVPTPGIAGAALTSYAGQVRFPAPVGGENVYLARVEALQGASIGAIGLVDRLWHNSGIVLATTTAQTVNSVAWPARDRDGSTAGAGVMVALEVATATLNGGAVANTTMSYTNSDGTPGRTATLPTTPATSVVGTFMPFMLAAGDRGVQSIQSVTLGTTYGTTGTIHLVAYRELVNLGTPVANVNVQADAWALGLPICYDNSVPFVVVTPTGTALGSVNMQVTWAQG